MRFTRRLSTCLFLSLVACILAGGARAGENGESVRPGEVILDTHSFWRCRFSMADPVVRAEGKLLAGDGKVSGPAEGWTGVEFDDSGWVRIPGPFFPGQYQAGFTWHEVTSMRLSLICMRGRFSVADPAAVRSLSLEMSFRGGAVVYLNGQEVTRRHMPAGEISSSSLAEDYPKEAFVKADGATISWGFKDPEKNADRLKLRTRTAAGLELPTKLLRRGTNVLAVEIHRAPYHQAVLLGKGERRSVYGHLLPGRRGNAVGNSWTTAGLTRIELRASGAGATPNRVRPKGLQVWNANPMQAVFDLDYGDSGIAPGPVKLVGTPGGTFSGQVVVSSDAPIRGLKAEVDDLKWAGGDAVIPASALRLRYARPGGAENKADGRYPVSGRDVARRFDTLAEAPPTEVPVAEKKGKARPGSVVFGAVQPVWVTVKVPGEAQPGSYRGEIKLAVEGQNPVTVPLHLDLSAWKLPEPREFRTFVDFIQSPESVALQYKVPLWSDEHWKRVEKSLELLGGIGSRTLYVPLICKTHFGNSQSMVRWTKTDGKLEPDFALMDRYLDLAEKHMGKPKVIVLYVFERYTGPGASFGKGEKDPLKWRPALVTGLDPAGGQVSEIEAPRYPTPESEKFWGTVMTGLRERLAERGLEKSMALGLHGDFSYVPKQVIELFKKVAPGVPWAAQGHFLATSIHGVPVKYSTIVWGTAFASDPAVKRRHGWKREGLICHYPRDMIFKWPLTAVRVLGEKNITGRQRGIGRLGADFWPVLRDANCKLRRGRSNRIPGSLAGRYPEGSWGQLTIKTTFLAPGPEGALSTVRFEMIREGVQECEARIFIEEALLDAGKRARLGEDLAQRCRDLLDERVRVILDTQDRKGRGAVLGHHYFVGSGWQERSKRLYDAAAEVAAKLGSQGR